MSFTPRMLAEAVDKVARQSAGKDWGLYANLLAHWVEIVGTDYARVTTPVKIKFPYQPNEPQRKNGTLTVRLPKGLAMEFSFKLEIIRSRINAYFGYEAFSKIALDPASLPSVLPPKQKPLPPEKIEEISKETNAVENEELRAALQSFGESMARR